jgi:hypothetical protein
MSLESKASVLYRGMPVDFVTDYMNRPDSGKTLVLEVKG